MRPFYEDAWLTVYGGDCFSVLQEMPAESVHTVVTSPPYWGLRDYGAAGQLGLEATPDEYVHHLVLVFQQVRRVLRNDGTVWLNLGDSYVSSNSAQGLDTLRARDVSRDPASGLQAHLNGTAVRPPMVKGLKPKDLVGIPWRVAFALQADGWYLRSDIIWSKPNPMPESVTDRPTKSHEYLFLLSKSPRYYFDADAVRETAAYPDGPNSPESIKSPFGQGFTRNASTWAERKAAGATAGNVGVSETYQNGVHGEGLSHDLGSKAGRNLRSVWTIATQPYPGAHFATFPRKLVEPCVKAGTSERGVCPECGAPWVRVVERERARNGATPQTRDTSEAGNSAMASLPARLRIDASKSGMGTPRIETTGWAPSCDHRILSIPSAPDSWNEPRPHLNPIAATVLDPFAGSGTTGAVAQALGRRAILIDLNPDYLAQAMGRNRDIPLGLTS